jgi:MFS family permease
VGVPLTRGPSPTRGEKCSRLHVAHDAGRFLSHVRVAALDGLDAALSVRLSVMMFLQYAIIGAWAPVFGPYLKSLSLTYFETAWIWSAAAIGSVLAPIVWGQIADRWLAAEKCISLCAIACGAALWLASHQEGPWTLFWLFLAFWMFQMPIHSIGAALTFRHLDHPENQFGPIRKWGTIGWMAIGWIVGAWLARHHLPGNRLADSLRIGAVAAWTLAIYAFTLPATPPLPPRALPDHHSSWRRRFDAPIRAIQLFRIPAFAVYCICLFFVYVSWPFNMQMTSLLVKSLDVDSAWLPIVMSISQTTEVLTLALLPRILERFRLKPTMMAGIFSWWAALVVLAIGAPLAIVIPSLLLHGVYICCFLIAGQVFVNRIAQHDFRASSQGLLVLINGLGQFIGNFLVAGMREWTDDNYPLAFLPAAIGVGILAVYFTIEFEPPLPSAIETDNVDDHDRAVRADISEQRTLAGR